jgi:hypothetical protein
MRQMSGPASWACYGADRADGAALLRLAPQALLHELRSGQRYVLEGDASRAAAQQGPTSLEELVGGWGLAAVH